VTFSRAPRETQQPLPWSSAARREQAAHDGLLPRAQPERRPSALPACHGEVLAGEYVNPAYSRAREMAQVERRGGDFPLGPCFHVQPLGRRAVRS
jgi:hypothetical protein